MAATLKLTATSPVQSFSEPVTLAEVEHALGLPALSPSDSERDSLLKGYISAARELAEVYLNRDLVQKQYDLRLDSWPSEIELRAPLVSVDKVSYLNEQGSETVLAEGTDYIVFSNLEPPVVRPPVNGTWPSSSLYPRGAILVRFTSGYSGNDAFWGDAGARVKVAITMIAAWLYYTRGQSNTEIPAAAEALLTPGRLHR